MKIPSAKLSSFSGIRLVCFTVIMFAFIALGATHFPAHAQGVSRTDEVGIRWSAIQAPKPVYPKAAIDKGMTGVVVASLLIGVDGRVETVVVLEAPDPLLASAVREAVKQWTFPPRSYAGPNGKSIQTKLAGNLTFYFRISNGIGQVLNPEEMPGARWPKRPVPSNTKAQPAAKAAVLKGVPDALITTIDKEELSKQLASAHPIILDIRERDAFRRGHHEGAVNIPFGELGVRAPIELSAARPIVIDCSQEEVWCQNAGTIVQLLQGKGFTKLTVYK